MARVLRRPKSGRPSSSAQGVRSVAGELGHETPEGRNAFSGKHELYLACKEEFRYRPNAAVLREAQSSEEAAFYMAIADFFLQQKQHELIEQGVY